MLKLTRGNIIIISISIIFLFCYFYYKYSTPRLVYDPRRSLLPLCYLGGGLSEWNERETAYKWTFPDACVLEFGGGAGSVSTVIQKILKNQKNHVVIQPPEKEMFGGITQLKKNRDACNSKFQIIDHVLKKGEEDTVMGMVSKPFDLIVADCENCLYNEYKKNPKLFANIKQIQVERDDFDKSYDRLIKELGMKIVHTAKCYMRESVTVEVWEK